MAELSEALLSVLPSIRVPKAGDRVHKDECAFSFDTPVSSHVKKTRSGGDSVVFTVSDIPGGEGNMTRARPHGTCIFPGDGIHFKSPIRNQANTTNPKSFSGQIVLSENTWLSGDCSFSGSYLRGGALLSWSSYSLDCGVCWILSFTIP